MNLPDTYLALSADAQHLFAGLLVGTYEEVQKASINPLHYEVRLLDQLVDAGMVTRETMGEVSRIRASSAAVASLLTERLSNVEMELNLALTILRARREQHHSDLFPTSPGSISNALSMAEHAHRGHEMDYQQHVITLGQHMARKIIQEATE